MKTLSEINQEIKNLSNLIAAEKQNELEEYSQKVNSQPLSEQRKLGMCRYPLKITDQLFNKGEKLLVKLVTENNALEQQSGNFFKSGVCVKLFQKDDAEEYVTGVVNNSDKEQVTVTLNTDFMQDWMLSHGLCLQIMFDNASYKEMENAIKTFADTDDERINHLKMIIYGDENPQFCEDTPFVPDTRLNQSQNQALRLINNAQDIAIVHGPPGTGKTTTLVLAIIQTLKTERQVLVCAPSNAAADLLTEKLKNLFINVVRIGQPARVTPEALENTLDAKIANHPNYKDIRALRRKADEYRRMAKKYKRNFGEEERRQRAMLNKEAKQITEDADHLAFYITSDILTNAQVITCTLVGAANREIKDMHYNTVFIDEAAQALEPACIIPLLRANRIVFAGDHKQLPPTVKSKEAIKGGLQKTMFEKTIENNSADVMLTIQYRMNEAIMQFSNQIFYDGKLVADNICKNQTVFDGDMPLEFIDTAGTGFVEKHNSQTLSTYNEEEAALIIKYLTSYIQNVELQGNFHRISGIGIISPYKAQTEIIKKYIKNSEIPDYAKLITVIDTADSFQGREKDVIIISLTRSNDKGEIGFLNDTRRMNVAMTRAKKKLIIFGDSATISHNKFYDNFVTFATTNNAYKSAFEIMY